MTKEFDGATQGRHYSTRHFGLIFDFQHLPEHLQAISKPFHDLAVAIIGALKDGPELTACLRKLREAKDCAVTQRIIDLEG